MSLTFECLGCYFKMENLENGRCVRCRSEAVLLVDFPETRDFSRGTVLPDFPYLSFPDKRTADRFTARIKRGMR
jgi:hypothetical protein